MKERCPSYYHELVMETKFVFHFRRLPTMSGTFPGLRMLAMFPAYLTRLELKTSPNPIWTPPYW